MKKNRKVCSSFELKLVSLAVLSCFAGTSAHGNPTGPAVVYGTLNFHQQGNLLQITNSPNAIINWQSFSIGAGEITRFLQQSASSAVLNRVITQNPSAILGALQSNGRVFLINPNGILFGAGAQIDVAGLVASTLNLSNADFLAGRLRFTEVPGAGSVVNQGNVTAGAGGQVYLVGPSVTNSGVITTPNGEVILAAGNSVELVNPGTPNLRVEITAPDNQAINLGQIVADSGRVGIYAGLINHSGTIQANSAQVTEDGRIVLKATKNATLEAGSRTTANGPKGGSVVIQSADTTLVAGAVEAKGSEGQGGSVQILGDKVGLTGNAAVNTSGETGGGTVLVGGDFQGKNPDVQNANRTFVGSDATIRADAIQSGDGGKVIVWADDWTKYYGSISARGGAAGGNGGSVEVSGKQSLDFNGAVDVGARSGNAGSVLLDPTSITIVAGSSGSGANDGEVADGTVLFTDVGGSFTITNGALQALSGDITLQSQAQTEVNASLNLTNQTTGTTVKFQAGGNMNVNSPITTAGGSLILVAGDPAFSATSPTPALIIASGANLTTNGGDITLRNQKTNIFGSINIGANVDAGSGVVHMTTAGGGIGQQPGGVITASALEIQSVVGVILNESNNVGTLAASVSSGDDFIFKNALTLVIGAVGGVSGITTSNGNVTLSAGGTVAVTQNIAAGTGSVNITTTGATSNIDGGGGTISSTNAVTGITLNAGGGIGIGTAVNTSSSGTMNLTTGGANAAGNISVVEAQGINTSGVMISTAAGSAQTVSLTSTSPGGITVGGDQDFSAKGNDNLTLIAAAGNITGGAGTITTTGLVTLVGTGVGTVANPVNLNLEGTGTLAITSTGVGSAADVAITETAAAGLNSNQIVDITSGSGDFASAQTITIKQTGAGGLTLGGTIDNTAFTGNDNLTFIATAGPGNAGVNSILTNSGNISFTAVGVTQLAGSTISAGTGTIVVNAGGSTINAAGTLISTNAGIAVDIQNATSVTGPNINAVNGTLRVGTGDISGPVTQTPGTVLNVKTLTGNTTGSVSAPNANKVTNLGAFTSNGNFSLNDTTGGLTLTGAVNAGGGGGVNLTSTGTISESGGGLVSTTGTLTTNSVGGQTLDGANQVSSFSATNSTVGDISLTNTAATLSLSGIAPAPGANVTINNTGSLVNVGTLTLSGGSSTFSTSGNSLTNAAGGVIQGSGTLNLGGTGKALTNSGTLSPGTSPGALTINGDLTMTPSSITNIEIQSPGVTAGTDYDRINVTGAAALDGTLNVTHLSGFSPSTGSFQIMTYATHSGDFATKNFPLGFSYNSLANATDYTLSLGALLNTWIAATGDWSVGTNWSFQHAPTSSEDAQIPDVAGAQTITVTSGPQAAKSVVLVGDETLSLTGGSLALTNASTINGTLSIAGGTLTANGPLSTNTLNLSSGTVNGSGNVTVTSGYTHTGGSINLGGSASITQALGNLFIGGPITAGSITATAVNGTISQAAGAILSTAGQLITSSMGGTTLNASNAVASFNATNASTGGIQFTNAAGNKLTVTGMSQTGGNVFVTADDLDITGAVNAGSSMVTLRPTTLAQNINIESTPTGGLSLSPGEIGFITAGILDIGRSDGTGTLTVSTPVGAGNVNAGTLRLLDRDIAVNASLASNGNLALNATNNVTVQNATVGGTTSGTIDVSATNNLSLTAVSAITSLLSTGAQTISAKGITLTGGGGTSNFVGAFISQTGPYTQSITAGSNGITLNAGNGTGGSNWAQINQTNAGGNQTIVVNGGNVALLGGTGSADNNAGINNSGALQSITVNNASSVSVVAQTGPASITSAGNQTLTIQGVASANALSIGSAAATNSSSITGANQIITAGTGGQSGSITILAGATAGKSSFISTSAGTQTVSTTGTLALTGGISIGGSAGCGPTTGGACAFINTNGTGLQHITANKIDMKGGDIGGVTGSFGSAGIFVSAGNMQLDVGAGGLVMQAGGGSATGNNGATIGGSNAAGRTLTLNVAGNTTLTGGSTNQSNAFIGLTGTGNLQAITVNLNGTGDVTLTGGSSTNTGAVIGTGNNRTNATSTLTVSGKDITLNPGSTGEARIGHGSAAPGPGDISVTATGNIALNGAGAVASAIRTTGNVTLQASGAGKTISEQSAGRIVANNLTAIADSGITLIGDNNRVASIAITNNNAGAVSFKNTTALDIAAGNVTNTGGNVTLNNTGAVTDTGKIVAGGLELLGAGPYTLDNASNSVTRLAANTTGAITYANAGALTVGTVNTTGITSGNQNVTLNAGGTVAVMQNIAAGTGAVNITTTGTTSNIDGGGGTISSTNAATGITLNAGGGIGIGAAVNTNVTGGGILDLTTHGAGAAGNMTLVEAGALTFSDPGNANTQFVGVGPHTFTLTGSSITVGAGAGGCGTFCLNNNGTLITTAGDILLQNNTPLNFGTGTLNFISAGDINVQGASVSAGTLSLTATNVSLTGGSAQNAVAEMSGGSITMNVAKELTLMGGSGTDAHALLRSNANFDLTIGTAIRLNAGFGSGAWAKMQTSSKKGLFNINFTNVLNGSGYFVNGVDGLISQGTTGFFNLDKPAKPGKTFFTTYP